MIQVQWKRVSSKAAAIMLKTNNADWRDSADINLIRDDFAS